MLVHIFYYIYWEVGFARWNFLNSSFVLYIHVYPNIVVMLSFIESNYKNKRFLNS